MMSEAEAFCRLQLRMIDGIL